ncbi:MAG: glycosyltransferase family 39 protein [Bacteroidia bacterium]|jgi:hypothetical protein
MSPRKNNREVKKSDPAAKKEAVADAKPMHVPGKGPERMIFYYLGLAIVLLLIFLIRKNYFNIPFERDEGSYTYAGKIILDGAIPFTDIGSQRLDGVFYAYALLVMIFGYSVKAMHIAFLLINMASSVAIFFLVKKVANSLAGLAAAAFFALLSMSSAATGFTTQSEHILILFVIIGFWTLFHFFENKKLLFLVLSGICFSLAFQIKQTCLFYGVLAGLLLLYKGWFDDKSGMKVNLVHVLVFSLSVIIPIAIDLFFVYRNGAWDDFMLWLFEVGKQYASSVSFDRGYENFKINFVAIYDDYKLFWVFAFVAAVWVFFSKMPMWKKIAIVGMFIAGFLTILPGYRFARHYFLQWFPAVCVSAAMFIFLLQQYLQKLKNSSFALYLPVALVVLPVAINLKSLNSYYFKPNHTQLLRTIYGYNPFPESKVIADKLNTVLKPEDQIAVLGTEIQMYVYTKKKSPSRFAGSGALLEFYVDKSSEWQKEFIADVEKAAPRFLIFYSVPVSWCANPKVENLLFPWFDKYTKDNYNIFGYADMLPEGTNYVWQSDIDMNNPPKSQMRVFVYERR